MGIDYERIIREADSGHLVLSCIKCDQRWKPTVDEQNIIAAAVRQYVADNELS